MDVFNRKGATSAEYLILLLLVSCAIIAIVGIYGERVEDKYRWADERLVKTVTF